MQHYKKPNLCRETAHGKIENDNPNMFEFIFEFELLKIVIVSAASRL